jgi:hypothetical protein
MSEQNLVNRLNKDVSRRFQSSTVGTGILTSIIVISGFLSAIFFWRHSAAVFTGLPSALATALGLAIGLIPSEGAFFGWKRIRASKVDMTGAQLRASSWGLWFAVGFAVANVIAIFITSFSAIPEAIRELAVWITFFALMLPIPTQFILFAYYVINEQAVVENHSQAELSALKHSAFIKGERARIGAVLEGMETELNQALLTYGSETGRAQAQRVLTDSDQNIVGQFYQGIRAAPPPRPQFTADDIVNFLAQNPGIIEALSRNTHEGNGVPRRPM